MQATETGPRCLMDKRELANGTARSPTRVRRPQSQVCECQEPRPRAVLRTEQQELEPKPLGRHWLSCARQRLLRRTRPPTVTHPHLTGSRERVTARTTRTQALAHCGCGPEDSGPASSFLVMGGAALPPGCPPVRDSPCDRQAPSSPRFPTMMGRCSLPPRRHPVWLPTWE